MQSLYDAVLAYDSDAAVKAAETAVAIGIDPVNAIEKGLALGLREIGELFESGDLWLPHLVLGAEALEAAIKVLEWRFRTLGNKLSSPTFILIS